ncbi:MAG: exo-alpha-sialidase [Bryobacterales bacterium]|nr:exo-alpha-sialidase [Bryobacterales bacterium]
MRLVVLSVTVAALTQTGSPSEPVRYLGGVYVDQTVHDGRLRPAIGVSSYQVVRANRTRPDLGDGFGWTYNHAPMLAHWNGKFYLEYLSNPIGEHEPPGQTLLVTSLDGRHWSAPTLVFPPYQPPAGTTLPPRSTGYMMHQRMGFFTAPDGRLLISAFYGHAPNPFRTGGIGRVVREVYKDGAMGPIYFVRYNSSTPWNEANTAFPFYQRSGDRGFVAACDALLNDKVVTEQWRDEDPERSTISGRCSAPSFFHRADGKVVGICKVADVTLSGDEGKTWSPAVRAATIITNNAKVWGQRTPGGQFALVYNPVEFGVQRWPLAVSTSADGIVFDTLNLVNGEVPPRRFLGKSKDFGAQYVRGIAEGNGDPGDGAFWVTYSMNKEDIWVSRIPAPVRDKIAGPVDDTFETMAAGGDIKDWNTYSPKWASVSVVELPGTTGKGLELRDKDPYDYARAVRVFPESNRAAIRYRIMPKTSGADNVEMEVMDRYGNRPVRVVFSHDGWIRSSSAAVKYSGDKWYEVGIDVDVPNSRYSLRIDGKPLVEKAALAETVRTIERLSFRTGPYRNDPTRQLDRYDPKLKDLAGADTPVAETVFYVDNVSVQSKGR